MTARQYIRSAAIIASAVMAACHGGGNGTPEQATANREAALKPRDVRLVTPEVMVEQPTLELVGEVRPFDSLSISPEVAGTVDAVKVEVGDRVRAGQPLAEIDRATFKIYLQQAEANLAAARADLQLAEKALERKRDLLSDQTIAQATYDEAEAAHALAAARALAAEAARDLARRNWEKSIVRAPAAGSITARHVVAGQWNDVGQTLFEMAVGESIKVAARVPATWAPKLTGLEEFEFTVGASSNTYRARLYSIDPVVQESSRSFEVVGVAKNPSGALRPGMFANVTLTSPESVRSLWLPASAIATSDMSQVMIVEDDAITIRRVQVGRRQDGRVEVVSGLAEGRQVVADVAGLNRGAPVRVVGTTSSS